jgi:hypothetical protein
MKVMTRIKSRRIAPIKIGFFIDIFDFDPVIEFHPFSLSKLVHYVP